MTQKPWLIGGAVSIKDKDDNEAADTAADLGRLRQAERVVTATRGFLQVKSDRCPMFLSLHRFMGPVSQIAVNHDDKDGAAPDPMVEDQGSRIKVRKIGPVVIEDVGYARGEDGRF